MSAVLSETDVAGVGRLLEAANKSMCEAMAAVRGVEEVVRRSNARKRKVRDHGDKDFEALSKVFVDDDSDTDSDEDETTSRRAALRRRLRLRLFQRADNAAPAAAAAAAAIAGAAGAAASTDQAPGCEAADDTGAIGGGGVEYDDEDNVAVECAGGHKAAIVTADDSDDDDDDAASMINAVQGGAPPQDDGRLACGCAADPQHRVPASEYGPYYDCAQPGYAVEVLIVSADLTDADKQAKIEQVDVDGRGAFLQGVVERRIIDSEGTVWYDVALSEFEGLPTVRVRHVYPCRRRGPNADPACKNYDVGTLVEWMYPLKNGGHRWYPGIVCGWTRRKDTGRCRTHYVINAYNDKYDVLPSEVRPVSDWLPAIINDRFVPRHDLHSECCDERIPEAAH